MAETLHVTQNFCALGGVLSIYVLLAEHNAVSHLLDCEVFFTLLDTTHENT